MTDPDAPADPTLPRALKLRGRGASRSALPPPPVRLHRESKGGWLRGLAAHVGGECGVHLPGRVVSGLDPLGRYLPPVALRIVAGPGTRRRRRTLCLLARLWFGVGVLALIVWCAA